MARLLVNPILFADELCLFQDSEDKSQRAIFILNKIGKDYNLRISKRKTKVVTFKGKYPIKTKVILENKPVEQISHFSYLGCDVSYNYEDDIQNKLYKFLYICGTIQRTLRNTRKDTRMNFFKTMAIPTLLYGSKTWTLTKNVKRQIQSSQRTFLTLSNKVEKLIKVDPFKHTYMFSIFTKFHDNPYILSHDIMRAMRYGVKKKSYFDFNNTQIL